MVKKCLAIAVLLATTATLTGCMGLSGSLYTDVINNATLINKDTSQKDGVGAKTGEACAFSVLGLVAMGDAGIKAAATQGGINNVKSMDMRNMAILGSVYAKHCTVVYGD